MAIISGNCVIIGCLSHNSIILFLISIVFICAKDNTSSAYAITTLICFVCISIFLLPPLANNSPRNLFLLFFIFDREFKVVLQLPTFHKRYFVIFFILHRVYTKLIFRIPNFPKFHFFFVFLI